MIETSAGLPNTCSECGTDPGATWFAENEDQARSGGGLCKNCAGWNPTGKKESGRKGRQAEPEPDARNQQSEASGDQQNDGQQADS